MSLLDAPLGSYMSAPVHTVPEGATLREAHEELERLAISALCVVDPAGRPCGVLSRTDLIGARRRHDHGPRALELPQASVAELMHRDVVVLDVADCLARAASLLVDRGIHRVFVSEAGRLRGVVSGREIMEAAVRYRVRTPLASFMSRAILSVNPGDAVRVAVERLASTRKRALPVMQDGFALGWFTQYEALLFRDSPSESPVEDWMHARVLTVPETMSTHRAAAHALAVGAQRVLAMDDQGVSGLVTGTDFAAAITG
ncbi:MAG: CBS domain-containing protein [Myxococcales bacterium]|nr:CBS domain-containing protein [Myxococcales bacterium]